MAKKGLARVGRVNTVKLHELFDDALLRQAGDLLLWTANKAEDDAHHHLYGLAGVAMAVFVELRTQHEQLFRQMIDSMATRATLAAFNITGRKPV